MSADAKSPDVSGSVSSHCAASIERDSTTLIRVDQLSVTLNKSGKGYKSVGVARTQTDNCDPEVAVEHATNFFSRDDELTEAESSVIRKAVMDWSWRSQDEIDASVAEINAAVKLHWRQRQESLKRIVKRLMDS